MYLLRQEALGGVGETIAAAAKIVEDPALPEVACNVLRLNRVVEGHAAGAPCVRHAYSAAQRARGVGLHRAVAPLRAYTWARQHPALAALAAVGVVGGLVGIGYWLGRSGGR